MRKKIIFSGACTALITPFKDGKIDYEALDKIIEEQISAGVGALLVGGTTGEAATLDDGERRELYAFARKKTADRTALILGTGSNDTEKALAYTRYANELGADAVLLVAPYYNKGTEDGVFRHFSRIAEECPIPQILYNVPSRTGGNLSINNLTRLSAYPNICGIKEASGSLERLNEIAYFSDTLPLYAGNDGEIFVTLALGGFGVISVLSNLFPATVVRLCRLFRDGRQAEARELQWELFPMIKALFLETNPAPIKYAMMLRGLCKSELRLPLALPSESVCRIIEREYKKLTLGGNT